MRTTILCAAVVAMPLSAFAQQTFTQADINAFRAAFAAQKETQCADPKTAVACRCVVDYWVRYMTDQTVINLLSDHPTAQEDKFSDEAVAACRPRPAPLRRGP